MPHPSEWRDVLDHAATVGVSVYLEIGVNLGYTMKEFAVAFPSSRLIGVEIDTKYPPPTETVEMIYGDSHSEATRLSVMHKLAGDSVDFLHIDGDHSEGGAFSDWYMYAPLVRPGGIVAIDDISMPSVRRTVDVISKGRRRVDCVIPGGGVGEALIWIPGPEGTCRFRGLT